MKFKKLGASSDKSITINVAEGHFATNHSHINYCVDITNVTSHHKIAKNTATLLADNYRNLQVDTIICFEGTNMLGAFVADSLSQSSYLDMNSGMDICVLTPEFNTYGQMIFRENTQNMVRGKGILLMLASVTTGKTIDRALECLKYYGGHVMGVCSVFSAIKEENEIDITSVFTTGDLDGYKTYAPGDCEMCAKGKKIDAIVNSYGFSLL